ncbi:TauD/TfdA family dioxygenase [Actinosynnema sp. CS-041913]|uniref:TauD/TfdA family dioxygenase n=1 Tax=Actinosynnema sp. CS-041913 TaxID=3239917 RepID=UPI003D8A3F14
MNVLVRQGQPPLVLADGPDRAVAHRDGLRADGSDWVAAHRDGLRAVVAEHGAVLVRGLGLADLAGVRRVGEALVERPFEEREGFAAREHFGDGLHSSALWPANDVMCMHHELSYLAAPPGTLLLACLRAPESGGASGIADGAEVLDALPADLVARFEEQGWLLERSYHADFGLPWPEAFGTDDRPTVEKYLADNDIDWQWSPGGVLRTRQRRAAVVRHPVDGRRIWFNQVAFLSEWTMDPDVRDYLAEVVDGFPLNTRYGDGEPLTPDVVRLINKTYEAYTRVTPWQGGDLLVLDNIRTAHSREPYRGDRRVIVTMGDPVRVEGVRG